MWQPTLYFVSLIAFSSTPLVVSLLGPLRPHPPTTKNTAVPMRASSTPSFLEQEDLPVMNVQDRGIEKLQGKLLKQIRETCLDYHMLEEGDHIMVCVSGGKDSAVMLYLLRMLQEKLPVDFKLTAVHVDQHQPGYDGRPLVQWLEEHMQVPYQVVSEDTYSIVIEKTPGNKSFCTVCSRLRRGILYSKAMELGCNKIALGHHADDAMETLLLNMLHAGQMKAMPARYTSKRGSLAVLRPLIQSMETDIERFAVMKGFPILPCNLCSNQANLQRPKIKLLLNALEGLNPNAKQNLLRAMSDIRPSHMLDQNLRTACGMDPITGGEEDDRDEEEELR
jgi:tRNA 2-thiocytidine biosynthesis protein TtcA